MDKQNYKPRIIDARVKEYLSAFGAVCIEGPKWCGKTWTSSYHSKRCAVPIRCSMTPTSLQHLYIFPCASKT